MLKVALGVMMAGSLAIAAPAFAQKIEMKNDLEQCGPSAKGAAVLVDVKGFAAKTGNVRLQSYPATKDAWLAKGAWLGRIETPVKMSGDSMRFCMPVPAPGKYGIAVRHDVNGNGKTDISSDGGGFSNNPSISIFNLGKPSIAKTAFYAGPGVTRITITLQYM